MSSDRWITTDDGEAVWGARGASGVLAYIEVGGERRYFLHERASWVDHGGTWGIPGGAVQDGLDPVASALVEFGEETGIPASILSVEQALVTAQKGDWTYTTVIARSSEAFISDGSHEANGGGWYTWDEMKTLNLHPDFARSIGSLSRVARLESKMYHLTDKADFKLDPNKSPENNTTMGGDLKPGIFLADDIEPWVNGYNYWRPWVVEFDASGLMGVPEEDGVFPRGYSGEVYVLAQHFDKLRVNRVIALDGWCREKYNLYGWTEEYFENDYLTGEPIELNSSGYAANKPPSMPAPDVRSMDSEWRRKYASRVKSFARKSGKWASKARGLDFKEMWGANRPTFSIYASPGPSFFSKDGFALLASLPMEYNDAANGVSGVNSFLMKLEDAAQKYLNAFRGAEWVDQIERYYLVIEGRGNSGNMDLLWNAGETDRLGGSWGQARTTVSTKYDHAVPNGRFMSNAMYGSADQILKFLGEEVAGVVVDDSLFDDVHEKQWVTIYRGISVAPGVDPLTSVNDSGGIGKSWTLELDTAKAIAERGMAGFTRGPQLLGDTYEYRVVGYGGKTEEVPVPTVLRAQVVIDSDGGAAPYRPWNSDYSSEREIDVPRGTNITIDGVLTASFREQSRYVTEYESYSETYVRGQWSWGSWRSLSVQRTASTFSPALVASWASSQPWNASRDDLEAQAVPGIVVGPRRGTETASYIGGKIVVTDDWFGWPEESRRAVLYHEAGHALMDAIGYADLAAAVGVDNALDIITEIPESSRLGYNPDEIVAECYAVVWTEPEWLEANNLGRIRDAVVTLARAKGFPLPSSTKTAAWRDVQQKARRLRDESGVKILSSTELVIAGEVRGDNGTYQTEVMFEPGTKRVALWHCGCPWASYSWGRSGRWRKFEGRMCFVPGSMVSMADGTFKPIEDVRSGDWVVTHEGIGQVSDTMERHHDGEVVSLRSSGYADPVVCTPEHPLLGWGTPQRLRKAWQENDGQGFKFYDERFLWQDHPVWIDAEALDKHDWLVERVREVTDGSPLDVSTIVHGGDVIDGRLSVGRSRTTIPSILEPSAELGFLLGFYIAEGSMDHRRSEIQWSVHEDEVDGLLKKLGEVCRKYDLGEARVYSRSTSKAASIRLSNAPLANLIVALCGNGSHTKELHPWLMGWRPRHQQSIIDAWFDGDGHQKGDNRKGISTVGDMLARQLYDLLTRCGHVPSWSRNVNNGGPANRLKRLEINLVSWVADGERQMANGRRKVDDWSWAVKVSNVSRSSYNGPVYDITVPGSHSFVINGRVVHNCAHALGLVYEAQSRGMYGGQVTLDDEGFGDELTWHDPGTIGDWRLDQPANQKSTNPADYERVAMKQAANQWTTYGRDRVGPPAMTIDEAHAAGYTEGPYYHATTREGRDAILSGGFLVPKAEAWEIMDPGTMEEFQHNGRSTHPVFMGRSPEDVHGYGDAIVMVMIKPGSYHPPSGFDPDAIMVPDPMNVVPIRDSKTATRVEAAIGRLYWHASPNVMPLGTELVPGGPGGGYREKNADPDQEWRIDWVWLSEDEELIYDVALKMLNSEGDPYLYLVEPLDKLEESHTHWQRAWITKRARIVGVLPIRFSDVRTSPYFEPGENVSGGKLLLRRWKEAFERGLEFDLAPGLRTKAAAGDVGANVYRGLKIEVDPDEYYNAIISGDPRRVAQVIIDAMDGSGDSSQTQSWSFDLNTAKVFAQVSPDWTTSVDINSLYMYAPIVIEGSYRSSDVQSGAWDASSDFLPHVTPDTFREEYEVRLRPGAPVSVSAVYVWIPDPKQVESALDDGRFVRIPSTMTKVDIGMTVQAAAAKIEAAGLIVRAESSGRVLMVQRIPYHDDDEDVMGRWEFPGGHVEEGEDPLAGAIREFGEETGLELPEYEVIDQIDSGNYVAFVVRVHDESWTTDAELLSFETMGIGWFDWEDIADNTEETLRGEVYEMDLDGIVVDASIHQAVICDAGDVMNQLDQTKRNVIRQVRVIDPNGVAVLVEVISGPGKGETFNVPGYLLRHTAAADPEVDPEIPECDRQENQANPFDGVTLDKDDDGWYVRTHRARSDSYPTPEDIPVDAIEFIRSTGAVIEAVTERSTMICLVPPVEVASILADSPGATMGVDQIHITLLYLGKPPTSDYGAIVDTVTAWAQTQEPFQVALSGVGTFDNPGELAIWAGVTSDPPGALERFQAGLDAYMAETPWPNASSYADDYRPHCTLAIDESEDAFVEIDQALIDEVADAGAWWMAYSVWVAQGDQWTEIQLGSMSSPPREGLLHEEPTPALPRTDGSDDDMTNGDDLWLALDTAPITKTTARVFTLNEQSEIINEDIHAGGVTARNLGSLDLSGTHYVVDDDDDILW
jgi:8-oxo-dGTP pyrophosphatase MutT (NUDIX family)/2'-5' RNA ligase